MKGGGKNCYPSGGNPVATFTNVLIAQWPKWLIAKARKGGRVV
jgi:hypothetical protein